MVLDRDTYSRHIPLLQAITSRFMSKHIKMFATAAIALSALLPAVALAQYGGGGGIIGGPFSVGYVPPSAPASAAPSSGGGVVLGASAYNFAANIRYGQSGTDVTELHKVLIAGGYLHISAPTGWFGPLTLAAVKQYQAANGIPATGFVGPLTRAVLNKGVAAVSDTKQGLVSKIVGSVQDLWGKWESTRAQ